MNESEKFVSMQTVAGAEPGARQGACMPVLATEQLFAGASSVAILHAGETYMLTCTKQNKLLLTKRGQAPHLRIDPALTKE